ncbi:MAG: cell division topological specificity factor MinE [Chloroflexi bacterium]|nr:cell division topological specificity factor MinE [Chloroflexota bacterium]
MTSLLNRLFGRAKRGSGATAKDRLHFVLQHDRINLPPERAEEMKKEILAVIVKYLAVDKDRVEIALEQRDRLHSKLVAEIPIVNETYKSENHRAQAAAAVSTPAESNGAGKVKESDADNASEDNAADDESKEPVLDTSEHDPPVDDGKR